jgi:hypothetical protein
MNDDNLNDVWRAEAHYGIPHVDDRGLPSWCFAKHYEAGTLTVVTRDVMGHNPFFGMPIAMENIDEANKMIGVTTKQSEAMQIGSMFGWHVPGADPNHEDGE